jgi:hypothetical protein
MMLPDPRPDVADLCNPRWDLKNKRPKLSDSLRMVFCAVLSGIEDGVGMEKFTEQKEPWWRGFLDLPNGIPAPDTLSDVFGRLKLEALAAAFLRWVPVALPRLAGEQMGGDGKTWRGSRTEEHAVHLMSAYAAKARWVLAQQPVGDKTNEITAIPTLLSMLELNGAVVSMDARGCPKTIARDLADAGAE